MSRIAFFIAAALLLLLVGGCNRRPPDDPSAAPVAWVNGQTISRAEFERELARSLELADGTSAPTPDQLAALRQTVLQARMDRLLFVQEAKKRDLDVQPSDVEERLRRMRADWPPQEFEALLAQRHQTLEELRAEIRAQLAQERLFHELVYPRVAVTEEEIRAELEAHPELVQEPEQVHAAQIVVKELDQAKEIRAKLREGAKFADLARQRSLSADAKDGGDLGWFPRGVMPPQFDEVAFSLGPGQISDVVTTDYGFHLFKVLERRPARKKDLAAVRAEVERKLLRAKQEQAQSDFVTQLRSKAEIRINQTLVAQVVPHALAEQGQENRR